MSVLLTPSADKNWSTAHWACLEESMARSLTVISLLLQSTTHCRYRVYTKFLLTYTAIYRGNRKVLPLGITALQPQSHFHLGTPYSWNLDVYLHGFCYWCLCWSSVTQTATWHLFFVIIIWHRLFIALFLIFQGKVVGFFDSWPSKRKFPVDMAGFAVSVEFLLNHPNATMPYKAGYEEDHFLRSLGLTLEDIEPKADSCTQVKYQ